MMKMGDDGGGGGDLSCCTCTDMQTLPLECTFMAHHRIDECMPQCDVQPCLTCSFGPTWQPRTWRRACGRARAYVYVCVRACVRACVHSACPERTCGRACVRRCQVSHGRQSQSLTFCHNCRMSFHHRTAPNRTSDEGDHRALSSRSPRSSHGADRQREYQLATGELKHRHVRTSAQVTAAFMNTRCKGGVNW
jgi:hypothetical protein